MLTETRAPAIREQSNLPANVSRSSEMQWGKGSAFVLIGGIGDDREDTPDLARRRVKPNVR